MASGDDIDFLENGIKTKKELIDILASTSFYYSAALREFISDKTNKENSFYIRFNFLFTQFQSSINYHYELVDFCDVYSQSLVYGLMLARLDTGLSLDEAALDYLNRIPLEYGLLYEFLNQAWDNRSFPTSIKTALVNIGKNINLIDANAIKAEFKNTNTGKETIAVYLYEDFLSQYDKLRETENRKEGGVYYTPKEAADFIARSVNYLLKSHLGLREGFMAPQVRVLDFACGTGTFLRSVFNIIIPKNEDEITKHLAKQKILNDIYGFEVLFTPYIISHTILAQFLKRKGIVLKEGDKLGIYLTNTLDIMQHSISEAMPLLMKESAKSGQIKNEEAILAIIGNPPYFNRSSKTAPGEGFIDNILADYSKGLNERKVNNKDLYIKFIRFAEWKIAEWNKESCGGGVVGIITNNSFLDTKTRRRMREHLYNTFDEIYILNLHGNNRRGEPGMNIFDIQVGVCIVFFVKHKRKCAEKSGEEGGEKDAKKVYYFSTLGAGILSREQKFDFLKHAHFQDVKWELIDPSETEDFWFVKKDLSHTKEYEGFWKLTDIFEVYNSGIQTKRDDFTIHYNIQGLKNVKEDFEKLSIDKMRDKYLLHDSRDWSVKKAKEDLLGNYNPITLLYRPFDNRITSLSKISKGFIAYPRYSVSSQFSEENTALLFTRDLQGENFYNVFITDKPVDLCIVNHNTYLAPLYIYNGGGKKPNWTHSVYTGSNHGKRYFNDFLAGLDWTPSPEEVLAYIYAVLHSNIYRKKYLEFLKTDFPAVPMTRDKSVFDRYAALGQSLIDLHKLKVIPDDGSIKGGGSLEGSFRLLKIEHRENTLLLTTEPNGVITIGGITPEIYNFEIGTYKVIDKWLKYRIKSRSGGGVLLNIQDLAHIKNMALAIKGSIALMSQIEALGEGYLG